MAHHGCVATGGEDTRTRVSLGASISEELLNVKGLIVTKTARIAETSVTIGVFPRRSTSETEALQTLSVALSCYQECHDTDAPQLAVSMTVFCCLQRRYYLWRYKYIR